jgi:hypothetical protein
LVALGEPCPLRLSGFSSLTDTPSLSNSISRRNSKKSKDLSRFPSRQPNFSQQSRSSSCDILEESDFETDNDVKDFPISDYESENEKDNLPQFDQTESKLEKVKDIITEPEDTWRTLNQKDCETHIPSPALSIQSFSSGQGNFSTTSKPHLIQPAAEEDILSKLLLLLNGNLCHQN